MKCLRMHVISMLTFRISLIQVCQASGKIQDNFLRVRKLIVRSRLFYGTIEYNIDFCSSNRIHPMELIHLIDESKLNQLTKPLS